MWIIYLLTVLPSLQLIACAPPASPCNGDSNFCDLKFDQVTFPGSHSAGSGSNGGLKECNGRVSRDSCIFQTQMLSITEQLNRGIRYLSLDVCVLPDDCNGTVYGDLTNSRLVSCRGSMDDTFGRYQYGGRLVDILQQINEWLKINTREVVGVHFTGNMPSQDIFDAYNDLVRLLESMWGEGTLNSTSSTEMSTYYSSNSFSWPTLREAIATNQRVFVFFDNELNMESSVTPWLNPTPFSTFEEINFETECINPGIVDHSSRCNATGSSDLIIAIGYTLGSCIHDAQVFCNSILENATDICYGFRITDNKTVNILLVDFPESGTAPDSVFAVATELNAKNVGRYLGPVTTLPPTTGSGDSAATNGSRETTTTYGFPVTSSSSANTSHCAFAWFSLMYCLFYYLYVIS